MGQLKRILALLTGRSRLIPILSDVEDQYAVTETRELDVIAIRIPQIIGTQGKLSFDKEFYPLQRRSRERWISVAVGMITDSFNMPPITAVKVKEDYYVIDGNHRVSVARALDYLYIDGRVTEWIVTPAAPD